MIIGNFGYQRSGKTALAMYFARFFQRFYGFNIYTNIEAEKVIRIENMSDIPVDYKPKVILFDEAYFYLDSRTFKDNKDFTLFLTTLGKQRSIAFFTAPSPDMIDKRVRNQLNYIFLTRGDNSHIYFQSIDVQRSKASPIYTIVKDDDFFSLLSYNSDLVIPNFINLDLDNYIKKSQGFIRGR